MNSTPVRRLLLPLTALLGALSPAHAAAAADPTAMMTSGVFAAFVGEGPVGNNDQNEDSVLYWRRESAGMLYQGQAVDSWYVFYDGLTTGNAVQGTISFDAAVVKVFPGVNGIIETNAYRDPTLIYNFTTTEANVELSDLRNTSISGRSISLRWDTLDPFDGDYMRVFTVAAPVPEPAGWLTLAAGLAAVGSIAARRQRRASGRNIDCRSDR